MFCYCRCLYFYILVFIWPNPMEIWVAKGVASKIIICLHSNPSVAILQARPYEAAVSVPQLCHQTAPCLPDPVSQRLGKDTGKGGRIGGKIGQGGTRDTEEARGSGSNGNDKYQILLPP